MWFYCAVFGCTLCDRRYFHVVNKLADRLQLDACPSCGTMSATPLNISIEEFQNHMGLTEIQDNGADQD